MVPLSPTNQPVAALTTAMARSRVSVPGDWRFQVAPPSVVLSKAPSGLAAHPVWLSAKATIVRVFVMPDLWVVQTRPPSVVLRIVPEVPTAQPVRVPAKPRVLRVSALPVVVGSHVAPPSEVIRTLLPPTAHPV